jgi:hypothetical protein
MTALWGPTRRIEWLLLVAQFDVSKAALRIAPALANRASSKDGTVSVSEVTLGRDAGYAIQRRKYSDSRTGEFVGYREECRSARGGLDELAAVGLIHRGRAHVTDRYTFGLRDDAKPPRPEDRVPHTSGRQGSAHRAEGKGPPVRKAGFRHTRLTPGTTGTDEGKVSRGNQPNARENGDDGWPLPPEPPDESLPPDEWEATG